MTVHAFPVSPTLPTQGNSTPGCYRELSPHEFLAMPELTVFLLKIPANTAGFEHFREVIAVEACQEVDALLAQLAPGQPIGLVCRDGGCTSRLAIRLSRLGHPVFHLAGGMWAWNDEFRGTVPSPMSATA